MDRFTEMEAFATVVELGGFSDAARHLGISKSAVSKHVMALEARLGARLLRRTTRRVAPTEVGRAYYGHARQILQQNRHADALVASLRQQVVGLVQLQVEPDLGRALVWPMLLDFSQRQGMVHLKVELAPQPADPGALQLVTCDPALPLDDDQHHLGQTICRLVATPGYLALNGHPRLHDELRHHARLERLGVREDGSNQPPPRLRLSNGEGLLQAALAGLGIAELPCFLHGPALGAGLLEEVLPAARPNLRDIRLINAPEMRMTPAMRAVIAHLRLAFAATRPDHWPAPDMAAAEGDVPLRSGAAGPPRSGD